MEPWLWAMQDADEAERRGDATAALAAVRRRLLGPDGQLFWRPSRLCRLEQLVLLDGFVPPWARSRWILEQALQHLSETDRGPTSRGSRALVLAAEVRGDVLGAKGVGSRDRHARVMDRDWVYRQVRLFELGGLAAFLRDGCSPDLVASADRIREWELTPMGGYVYLGPAEETLLWRDLASGTAVRTPNIGTGLGLAPGAAVIGRAVPVEGGVMFESVPLAVPRQLAADVAAEPGRWMDLLRESGAVRDGTVRVDGRVDIGLLSDVPLSLTALLLCYSPEERRVATDAGTDVQARHVLDAAAEAVAEASTAGEDADAPGEDCELGEEYWAQLHAALLDPGVLEALPRVVELTGRGAPP